MEVQVLSSAPSYAPIASRQKHKNPPFYTRVFLCPMISPQSIHRFARRQEKPYRVGVSSVLPYCAGTDTSSVEMEAVPSREGTADPDGASRIASVEGMPQNDGFVTIRAG